MAGDAIPCDGSYRGCPLHAGQSEARLVIVRCDIDECLSLVTAPEMASFAANTLKSPESRMLAAAMCESVFEMAQENREERPRVNLEKLRADVCALNSKSWQSPFGYGSLLESGELIPRDEELTED